MECLNGCLVGLCILDGQTQLETMTGDFVAGGGGGPYVVLNDPMARCVGFGIIRGVNCHERTIALLTPIPNNLLQAVNLLVRHQDRLPTDLLSQSSILCPPFCTLSNAAPMEGTGASTMRSRNDLKRKYIA